MLSSTNGPIDHARTIWKNCLASTARSPSSSAAPACSAARWRRAGASRRHGRRRRPQRRTRARTRRGNRKSSAARRRFLPVDVTQRTSIEDSARRSQSSNSAASTFSSTAPASIPPRRISRSPTRIGNACSTQPAGTHWGCQIFGAHMVEPAAARFSTSAASRPHLPLSRVFAYSASKAAVVNLTQNVAREFAPHERARQRSLPRLFPGRAEPQDPRPTARSKTSCAKRRWPASASRTSSSARPAAALAQGRQLHHRRGDLRRRRLHGHALGTTALPELDVADSAWILPALGLSIGALALTTWVRVKIAAVVLGGAWLTVLGAAAVYESAPISTSNLAPFAAGGQIVCATLAVGGAVVLLF